MLPITNYQLLITVLLFVSGTAVGSFLNVVSRRLLWGKPRGAKTPEGNKKPPRFFLGKPRGFLGLIQGRSRCESCGKTLGWRDLIPLVSFILLRGRCRYCKAKLSLQYPIVELGTGLLFAALGWQILSGLVFPITNYQLLITVLSSCFLLLASCSLIVILITDFYKQLIFDRVVVIGIVSALIYRVLANLGNPGGFLGLNPRGLLYDVLLAAAAALLFFLLHRVTKGKGMGEGDAPLAFLVTLLPGCPLGILALWLAFVSGALVGIVLVLLRKKKLKSRIAFGPFLVLATFATLLFGDAILDWYIRITWV